jgi:alanine dehydrogenase
MALLIDNDVTDRVLSMDDALPAMEDAFTQLGRGEATFHPRVDTWSPTAERGDYHWYAAMIGAMSEPPRLALRFRSDVTRQVQKHADEPPIGERFNVEPGTFMGFVLLYDTSEGSLIGLLNDGVLQHTRVGATVGVACDQLAHGDASTIGILGSGGMARSFARAFALVRDVESITVYSPTRDHREAYAEEMSEELGVDITAVSSGREAVRGTDVVGVCTNARNPVFMADWLEPGQFITNVTVNEIDPAVFDEVDRVFATANRPYSDAYIGTKEEREAVYPMNDWDYQENDFPRLDQLLVGNDPGRRTDDETLFYYNNSSGLQFAAVCSLIYERAKEQDLGTEIPLSWFQQDVVS